MTAFDTAWDLLKEWNPGWRNQARHLPILGSDDLLRISQQWLEDTGQTEPDYVGYEDFPSGQTMKYVLPHPKNPNFVIKVPRSLYSEILGEDKDEWYNRHDFYADTRFGAEYHGKNLIQELEDLGFPVVSEHHTDMGYLVQPWLDTNRDYESYRSTNNRPKRGIADIPLNHIVADRSSSNWGIDQTGNWRMFDVDMGLNEPIDYWPSSPETPKEWLSDSSQKPKEVGELLQQDLDKWGIQLPVSRLLNFMSYIDHDRPGMQNFLETLEPYSDNPNYVTIDGKPVWREGY